MEDVLAGLFLSGLEASEDLARPLFGPAGRTLTVGVDSGGAAATVIPLKQFEDYPLEPNALSKIGAGDFTANGDKVRTWVRGA